MTPDPSKLRERFAERILQDHVTNNVLRGSWVEEIVAFFIDVMTFPGQWSYFDLRTPDGYTVSVKHGTGRNPTFVVRRSQWAWDNELALDPSHEGWRGGATAPLQYWCDVYVFAWLDGEPTAETVLDALAWRFVVMSRGAMYRAFEENQKRVGLGTLRRVGVGPIDGSALPAAVRAAGSDRTDDVPPLDDRPYEHRGEVGPPPSVAR